MSKGIAVFGGTFDPIHIGHLQSALEVRQALDLSAVRLIPAFVPPHREQPGCSAEHRLAMVRLAIRSSRHLVVDEREIERGGPSYTLDTLTSIREEIGDEPLIAVMGIDSFLTLPAWHRWRELTERGHILVLDRPGWCWELEEPLASFVAARLAEDLAPLRREPCGAIARLQTTQLEISATRIRALIGSGGSAGYLLPECVGGYIEEHGIYRSA